MICSLKQTSRQAQAARDKRRQRPRNQQRAHRLSHTLKGILPLNASHGLTHPDTVLDHSWAMSVSTTWLPSYIIDILLKKGRTVVSYCCLCLHQETVIKKVAHGQKQCSKTGPRPVIDTNRVPAHSTKHLLKDECHGTRLHSVINFLGLPHSEVAAGGVRVGGLGFLSLVNRAHARLWDVWRLQTSSRGLLTVDEVWTAVCYYRG